MSKVTQQQAEAVATLVALSGGNTISGDRLVDLEPAKLEVLKKILPAYGDAATPVDLFEAAAPATFVLHVERPFARWTIVALFNADLTGADYAEKAYTLSVSASSSIKLTINTSKAYSSSGSKPADSYDGKTSTRWAQPTLCPSCRTSNHSSRSTGIANSRTSSS